MITSQPLKILACSDLQSWGSGRRYDIEFIERLMLVLMQLENLALCMCSRNLENSYEPGLIYEVHCFIIIFIFHICIICRHTYVS